MLKQFINSKLVFVTQHGEHEVEIVADLLLLLLSQKHVLLPLFLAQLLLSLF